MPRACVAFSPDGANLAIGSDLRTDPAMQEAGLALLLERRHELGAFTLRIRYFLDAARVQRFATSAAEIREQLAQALLGAILPCCVWIDQAGTPCMVDAGGVFNGPSGVLEPVGELHLWDRAADEARSDEVSALVRSLRRPTWKGFEQDGERVFRAVPTSTQSDPLDTDWPIAQERSVRHQLGQRGWSNAAADFAERYLFAVPWAGCSIIIDVSQRNGIPTLMFLPIAGGETPMAFGEVPPSVYQAAIRTIREVWERDVNRPLGV